VASPPVPCGITSGDGGFERAQSVTTATLRRRAAPAGWTPPARARPPLPPAAQGDSATRHVCCIASHPLRLRCAPSSASASRTRARSVAPEGAAAAAPAQARVASPLVMANPSTRTALSLQAERPPHVRGRHYPLLRRGIAPHDTSAASQVIRSGCAALRPRQASPSCLTSSGKSTRTICQSTSRSMSS
jgi:hypothetical protein